MVKVPHPFQDYSPLYRVPEITKSICGDKIGFFLTLTEDIHRTFSKNA
ncbi:MAG: hypothetical protein RMX68_028490 [Aulosira sp. ZfuVER01]|nr:hypothetical protein [Aulosira sp. ZfuVER01]MDZ7997656.1 hypothetical protein [Aulosira sp. DedVER01a]MDZ8055361.1 hypothetical protein [Aulosira sp. ZfuCHP01]